MSKIAEAQKVTHAKITIFTVFYSPEYYKGVQSISQFAFNFGGFKFWKNSGVLSSAPCKFLAHIHYIQKRYSQKHV